jgi:hypothetical protein
VSAQRRRRRTTSSTAAPGIRTPRTNGFVERFNGTVLDEFFLVGMLLETIVRIVSNLSRLT